MTKKALEKENAELRKQLLILSENCSRLANIVRKQQNGEIKVICVGSRGKVKK